MGSHKAEAVKAGMLDKATARYKGGEGKMVSLKRSASEMNAAAPPVSAGGDNYPYGTRITLEGESVSKVFGSLPKVGAVLELEAKVKVVGVRESDGSGKSVELQITHCCIE